MLQSSVLKQTSIGKNFSARRCQYCPKFAMHCKARGDEKSCLYRVFIKINPYPERQPRTKSSWNLPQDACRREQEFKACLYRLVKRR